METIKTIFIMIWLFSIILLSSCQKYQEGPAPGMRVNDIRLPDATLKFDEVVVLDKTLHSIVYTSDGRTLAQGKIAIESKGKHKTSTGVLAATVVIRNRTDFPLQLECRIQFFDAHHHPIDGPTSWQRVFLPPNGIGSYQENSTKMESEFYYIEIREGR